MQLAEWDEAIEAAWAAFKASTRTIGTYTQPPAEYYRQSSQREALEDAIRAAAPLIAAATLNKAADEADAMVFRNDGGPQWLRERAKEAGGG